MELIVIALTIAFVARDPAGTIRAAAAYKQASADQARAQGRNPRRASNRALRNYLATVWDHRWEEAARRYPQRMVAAQLRRSARRQRRSQRWERMQGGARRRWEQRLDRGEPSPLVGRAAPDPVPEGVVDLDSERRRREEAAGGPEEGAPDPNTTPEDAMNLSDAASLRAHLAALEAYSDYWNQCGQAKERLAANMREAQLGEGPVGAVDASREATASAAEQAQAARQALEEANLPVAEARTGSPDAGHGDYYKKR